MNIAIIKLGAKGDVIRTLAILPAVHKKYPSARITWITKPSNSSLLEKHPQIADIETIPYRKNKKFDLLFNFDIEKEATELASKIEAKEKYGFSYNEGYPGAYNPGAEYYLETMFNDDLKKRNKKTYQEMMFSAANLSYNQEKYSVYLDKSDLAYADKFWNTNKLTGKRVIGIHLGSSPRWPSKVWAEGNLLEFISLASKDYQILLFSGPDDSERTAKITQKIKEMKLSVIHNDPLDSDRKFASLVGKCDYLVCSDSFALHVSLALNKKTIGLFFCTSPYEIEGYNLLVKLVSPQLMDFFPERMDEYNKELTESIQAKDVLKAVHSFK